MDRQYIQAMADGFEKEMKKIAAGEVKAGRGILGMLARKEVLLPVGGALAYKAISTAEQDRQTGRQIRMQQQGY